MKRKIAAVLCILLAAQLFAGCGKSEEEAEEQWDYSTAEEEANESEEKNEQNLLDALKEKMANHEESAETEQESTENVGGEDGAFWDDDMVIEFKDESLLQYARGATGIEEGPLTYGDVKGITGYAIRMTVNDCKDLSDLKYFTSIRYLKITNCEGLTSIGGWGNLPELESLTIEYCPTLTEIICDLGDMPKLSYIYIIGCENLSRISCSGNFAPQAEMDITSCKNLTDISGIENMSGLAKLELMECESLTSVSYFQNMPDLEELKFVGCNALLGISGLENLPSLKTLKILACRNLVSLSGWGELPSMTSVDMSQCGAMIDISALTSLPNLERIFIFGSTPYDISFLENMQSLTDLEINTNTGRGNITLDNLQEAIQDYDEWLSVYGLVAGEENSP